MTIISLVIGGITLILFILRQLRLRVPMLEFRVFKNPIFTLSVILPMIAFLGRMTDSVKIGFLNTRNSSILPMIAFLGLIGTETLIPLYMQNMRGFSAMESGMAILPGALVNGMMSPITGKIFDRYGAKWLAVIGFIILTVSTFAFTNLGTSTSMLAITILYAIRMFGISMVMMPATTAGLNQLKDSLIPHGIAMTNTLRQVAASIGTAVLVTVMTITTTTAQSNPNIENPSIHGVNVAFIVLTVISALGIVPSFFIEKPRNRKRA